MKKSNFYKLFSTLNNEECRGFKKYLEAFHGGKNTLLYKLYLYYLELDNRKLDKYTQRAFAYSRIAPKRKYSADSFSSLLSKLNKALNLYLIHNRLASNELELKFETAQIYKERNLNGLYLKQNERFVEEANKTEANIHTWYLLFRAYFELYFYPDFNRDQKGSELINSIKRSLLETVKLARNKIKVEEKNRQNISNVTKAKPQQNLPLIESNSEIANLFNKYSRLAPPTPNHFDYLFNSLKSVEVNPDSKELEDLFMALFQMGSTINKKQDMFFFKKVLQLVQYGIDLGLFKSANDMVLDYYLNFIEYACKSGALNWAKSFAKAYLPNVKEQERVLADSIAKAIILFSEGHYDKANNYLPELNTITFPAYKLRVRVLRIACLFEIEALGLPNDKNMDLLDTCSNDIKYIKKHPQVYSESFQKAFINFVRIVIKLVRKKSLKKELWEDLYTRNPCFNKVWLKEKIENYRPIL